MLSVIRYCIDCTHCIPNFCSIDYNCTWIKKIALTGIKPTGTPHLGNYLGAIKPALALAKSYDARYFIADYHALNSVKDPQALKTINLRSGGYLACLWLGCG